MSIFNLVFLVGLLVINTQTTWSAARFECDSPQTVGQPGLDDKGIFSIELQSNCKIEEADGGGLAGLEKDLVEKATRVQTVHSGPISKEKNGLKGTAFDVTSAMSAEQGSGTIRADVFIGTDYQKRLLYSNVST